MPRDDEPPPSKKASGGDNHRHRGRHRDREDHDRRDRRHNDRRYDDRRHDDRRYDDRRHDDRRYDDRRYGDRRHGDRRYDDRHYRDDDRFDDRRRHDRRDRRSPSLSPLSRHRKLQRENKERAEKLAASSADGNRFWDGFQWVDKEGAADVTVNAVGDLHHATRKERRLYVGNLPQGVGLTDKQVGEFVGAAMKASGHVAEGNPVISTWVAPEQTYAFVELHTMEQANAALTLNGIELLGSTLRFSRPNNYNPLLGMPVDQAAALAAGAPVGGYSFQSAPASLPGLPGLPGLPPTPAPASVLSTLPVTPAAAAAPEEPPAPQIDHAAAATAAASTVLRCSNMLTPAELAVASERAALREDVDDECRRFGKIDDMRVPTSANPTCDIYVRFDTPEAAARAMAALHGRMFDGRTVEATLCAMAAWDAVVDGA